MRCAINITICDHNDAIQSHTWEMRWRIQTYKMSRKNQSPNVHGRHRTVCKKCKRIGNLNTASENIQSGYRYGIWHRKCGMLT